MFDFPEWKSKGKSFPFISNEKEMQEAQRCLHSLSGMSHGTPELLEYKRQLKDLVDHYHRNKPEVIQTDGGGLRYNTGKPKHHLIPGFAMNEVAKVFTFGADKYGDNNWQRGMDWSDVIGSMSRHYNAILRGEDFDNETGYLHSSHLATNAIFLTEYYRIYPQGDDRLQTYKRMPKVALDIDGVLANFSKAYSEYITSRGYKMYPQEEQPHWGFPNQAHKDLWGDVKSDKDFWVNMEATCDPNLPFEPVAYVTARSIPEEWTHEWLVKHGFPDVKIYSSGNRPKSEIIKKIGADLFVDDCYENFCELNNAGVCTFLMHTSYNRKYEVGAKRIYALSDILTGEHLTRR